MDAGLPMGMGITWDEMRVKMGMEIVKHFRHSRLRVNLYFV